MARPRLLDLFCGAGGCAKGFQRAGFYVVGVDNRPQPNYCGDEFHQADALEVLRVLLSGGGWQGYRLEDFAAIHASPPCKLFTVANRVHAALRPTLFESNVPIVGTVCRHDLQPEVVGVYGNGGAWARTAPGGGGVKVAGADAARALGIDWTDYQPELSQAIPPAYAEHIGHYLMRALDG